MVLVCQIRKKKVFITAYLGGQLIVTLGQLAELIKFSETVRTNRLNPTTVYIYIYIYKVVVFVCVCVCVYNSPTAHTTGPIMTKPGMMMVPHLGMVHTIFQGQGHSLCIYSILSYSPHHWTDHDQTWRDDGPPPRDGAHHFPR